MNKLKIKNITRGSQETELLTWLIFFLNGNKFNQSCPTILTQKFFGRIYHITLHYITLHGLTDKNENFTTNGSHHAEHFYPMSEFC